MIEFHDPRGEPSVEVTPYELSETIGEGKTVGLLANGFPDSVRFLDQLETALESRLPGATIKRYDKGNASIVLADQLLDGITKECHAVVTAYGH